MEEAPAQNNSQPAASFSQLKMQRRGNKKERNLVVYLEEKKPNDTHQVGEKERDKYVCVAAIIHSALSLSHNVLDPGGPPLVPEKGLLCSGG